MLRVLRENTGNWIIKILLGMIVVAFVFVGMGSLGTKKGNIVATVNDSEITINEYQETYRQITEQMRARFGDYLDENMLKLLNVRQQALDQLIEERLIGAAAEKFNIKVSDEEVQSLLMSVDAFKENGIFNIEKYKRVLGANQMNPEIFEAQQFRVLRDQKIINLMFDTIVVSDLEAENWFTHKNTKVVIDYLHFDPLGYTDITPEETEIEAYYNENKENYKTEPKRIARYLRFSPEDYKNQASITREQVELYYSENKAQFDIPEKLEARHILIKIDDQADETKIEDARKQAADIYEQAKSGQDFAELAKQFSQGPSAPEGGYLGTFAKGEMVKPFEDAAFSLNPGEISPPVRTQFGWHVIKVEKKFEASVVANEAVYKDIETQLLTMEAQNMAYSDAENAFEAVLDGDSLEQAAMLSETKQGIQNTDAFSSSGKGLTIEDAARFAAEAFKLSLDTISDVLPIGTAYYLIHITETIEPQIQPLEQVKEQAVKDLIAKMQIEKAQTLASDVLSEIEATTLEQVALAKELTVKTTLPVTLNDTVPEIGISQDFMPAAFNLYRKGQTHTDVIQTPAGFFIISLNDRIIPDSTQISDVLEQTKQEILSSKQNQIYRAWIEDLRQTSDIQINTDFIN